MKLSFKQAILTLSLFIIASGIFLPKIIISNTPNTYMPEDLDSKVLNDQLIDQFNNDDSIVILFRSNTPLDKKMLNDLSQFVDTVEADRRVRKVRSIFNYESLRSINDGFEVTNIIDANKIDEIEIKEIEKKVSSDRFVKDLFVTKDMKTFGVLVETDPIYNSIDRLQFDEFLHQNIVEKGLESNLIAFGGEFTVDTAQFKELNKIMFVVVPITFIVGALLLYYLFHSISAVIIGVVFNGLVANVVLSLFGVFGWPYNLIGSMIPTLMMALCIAFIVHLYNGIMLRKQEGQDHEASILNTVKSINKPSFFSALTTSAGLFSLTVSSIPPVRSVGVIGGLGVLFIYFMVLYVLPPILIRFNKGEWKQNKTVNQFLNKIVESMLEVSIRHYGKIIIVMMGGLIGFSAFIFQVKSESNLYKFFNPQHPVNVSSDAIKENFVGTTIVNIVFDKQEENLISKKFNQKIDSLKENLVNIENVGRVFSATDIIKQLNWAFLGEKGDTFKVPESDELINQYLFIYDGEDIYDFLSRDQERFKMTLNLNVQGANQIEQVLNQVTTKIKEIGFSGVKWAYAGYGKMFSDQENLIIEDLHKSVAISFAIIFLLMLTLWRSFAGALFCMIPNASPVITMFIVMGMFGIWLDMGTAMIASVTVGIAIDDTIHVYEGFMSRMNKMSVKEALFETYSESGRAVIITSIILSAQFLVLMFVDFMPLKNFGLLTTIGILTALVYDLLLLPAMILFRFRSKLLKS